MIRYSSSTLPKTYLPLIHSHWKRSLRKGNDYFNLVKPDAYYSAYTAYIDRILDEPGTAVRMAVLAEDYDVVLGFAVTRGRILDYVYVQKDFRRVGIGSSLVPADIDTITHLTKTALTIWGSKYPGWTFNPFA